MVIESRSLSVSMNKQFREIWPEFTKLVEKSPRFKEMISKQLNHDGQKSKTFNKGKDSAKVFFAVAVCFKSLLKEQEELAKNKEESS